jgi:hypothetical protein
MGTVHGQAVKTRKCVACINGSIYNAHNRIFGPCKVCSGVGYIAYEYNCACGRPITTRSTSGHYYCGQGDCLKLLQADSQSRV